MKNRKRLGALLLCIALVLVLAASSVCIVYAAGHCCVSVHRCPLCNTVALATHTLRVLGMLVVVIALQLMQRLITLSHCAVQSAYKATLETPVSRKTRLNN